MTIEPEVGAPPVAGAKKDVPLGYSILLAVAATVLPSFFMNAALHRISAQGNAAMGILGPVSTLLLAVAILGETLTPIGVIGSALVLAGVGWFTLADRGA